MAAAIQKAHPGATVELEPGGRGDFTVRADDRLIWDKHQQGGFPQEREVLERLSRSD